MPDDRTGVGASSADADSPARLYHELRSNAEWRLLFADRVQKHFFDGGALSTNQTIPRFLRLCDTIDRAIVGESARWGDVVRRTQPYTRNVEWLAEKNRLLTEFFPQRTDRVVQQFVRAGLYPSLAAPAFSPGGGVFVGPFQLSMLAPAGAVYYTTNGHDPRPPGGMVAPEARLYGGPITIATSQQVRARAWRTNTWSALAAADFTTFPVAPSLTILVSGAVIEISWPPQAGGFVLETTKSLDAPVWTAVDGAVGSRVAVSAEAGSRFYRLRHSP